MSVYSGTFAPTRPADSPPAFRDPIADAREKLRQAARLPFHASRPNAWQESFCDLVAGARASLRRHIWLAGHTDSPLNRVEQEEPRLISKVEQQREEHALFSESIDVLVDDAGVAGAADIWKMIELGEQAILLEMALARHHNRLSQLLYEATHVDTGVAG